MERNKKIAFILRDIARLLDIEGVAFKPAAYRRAAESIEALNQDIGNMRKKKIAGVGPSIAQKIAEFLKKKKIRYYEELKEKTAIRQIVTHFFETKGVALDELKLNARKRKIIYARFTRPAKQLLELAGSIEKAKNAITKIANWANSRNLDYSIETVFKKWPELGRLKPKEVVKKPFYKNNPMVWSETKKKWFVVTPEGDWLEFAGDKKDVEWKIVK